MLFVLRGWSFRSLGAVLLPGWIAEERIMENREEIFWDSFSDKQSVLKLSGPLSIVVITRCCHVL